MELHFYQTALGKQPFRDWLESLRDTTAAARIEARLARVAAGSFGDSSR